MSTKETGGHCVVCSGIIVEAFGRVRSDRPIHPTFGPHSAENYHEVSLGFHCQTCGLKYAFVPPNMDIRRG